MEEKKVEEDKLFVYGVYVKLIDSIKHIDTVQTYYRTLASSVLLATFAALGFIFTNKGGELSAWPGRGGGLLCMLAFLAINAIKILDIKFQEEFLVCNFVEALRLERKYKWLPQAHNMMLYKGEHFAATNKKVLFYVGCNTILLIIVTISWIHFFGPEHSLRIFISCLAFFLFWIIYVKTSLKLTYKINKMIASKLKME